MIKYRSFLDHKDLEVIDKTVHTRRWSLGHVSNKPDEAQFWKFKLNEKDDSYFYTTLYNKIKEITKDNLKIKSVYFNGHNACSQGKLHADDTDPNARTFLIYANSEWHPEWGGGTGFILDKNTVEYIYPYPGSAVYFNSTMIHSALPISKEYKGTRLTLAYKLRKE